MFVWLAALLLLWRDGLSLHIFFMREILFLDILKSC